MIALLLTLTLVSAAPPTPQPLDALGEARVVRLGKKFRCAVCNGATIFDSPTSMARAQMEALRELVADHRTDEEIEAYFVGRYGGWVLLQPPAQGVNPFLWIPALLMAIAGIMIVLQVRKKPAHSPSRNFSGPPA